MLRLVGQHIEDEKNRCLDNFIKYSKHIVDTLRAKGFFAEVWIMSLKITVCVLIAQIR